MEGNRQLHRLVVGYVYMWHILVRARIAQLTNSKQLVNWAFLALTSTYCTVNVHSFVVIQWQLSRKAGACCCMCSYLYFYFRSRMLHTLGTYVSTAVPVYDDKTHQERAFEFEHLTE